MILENANICGLIFKGLESESWSYFRNDILLDISGNLALFGGGKALKALKALRLKTTPKWVKQFVDSKVKKLKQKAMSITGTDKLIRVYNTLKRVTSQGYLYNAVMEWVKKQSKKIKLPLLPKVKFENQIRRLKNLLSERKWRLELKVMNARYNRKMPTLNGLLKSFILFWKKGFAELKTRTKKAITDYLKKQIGFRSKSGGQGGFILLEPSESEIVKTLQGIAKAFQKPKPSVSPKQPKLPDLVPGSTPNKVPFRRTPKAPTKGLPLRYPSRNPVRNPSVPDKSPAPQPRKNTPADPYKKGNPTNPDPPIKPEPPKVKPTPAKENYPESDPSRITPPTIDPPTIDPPTIDPPTPTSGSTPPVPRIDPPAVIEWRITPIPINPISGVPQPVINPQGVNNQVTQCKCDQPKRKQFQKYMLQYCECDDGNPKIKTAEISAESGSISSDLIEKFRKSAELAATGCRKGNDPIVFPENYQIRLGSDIPQAVLLWREVKSDDGAAANTDENGKILWGTKRSVTNIPHCTLTKESDFPTLSPHKKGQYYARLTLKDNSNSWIYAETAEKASEMMAEIVELIDPEKVGDTPLITVGERRGKKLDDYLAYPYKIEYYAKGQQQGVWDWRLDNDS
jgi:hypothetical protein